jgi:hypothetical protein
LRHLCDGLAIELDWESWAVPQLVKFTLVILTERVGGRQRARDQPDLSAHEPQAKAKSVQ